MLVASQRRVVSVADSSQWHIVVERGEGGVCAWAAGSEGFK